MKPTQTQSILTFLKKGRSLTPIQALKYWGCFRLGARIHDLKKSGHNIVTKPFKTATGKIVAKYCLASLLVLAAVPAFAQPCEDNKRNSWDSFEREQSIRRAEHNARMAAMEEESNRRREQIYQQIQANRALREQQEQTRILAEQTELLKKLSK